MPIGARHGRTPNVRLSAAHSVQHVGDCSPRWARNASLSTASGRIPTGLRCLPGCRLRYLSVAKPAFRDTQIPQRVFGLLERAFELFHERVQLAGFHEEAVVAHWGVDHLDAIGSRERGVEA